MRKKKKKKAVNLFKGVAFKDVKSCYVSKKTEKTKTMKKSYVYIIILALLAIILLLAFNFVNTPEYKFADVHAKDMEKCTDASYTFTPDQIAKAIIDKDVNTIFVDVRSMHDFINGHIPEAIHIDKSDVLGKDNYTFFSNLKGEKKQVIFYGKDVVEANIPFMILKQMGIENIGISCEGYNFFNTNDIHHIATTKSLYPNNETPVTNIANYITQTNKKALEKAKAQKKLAKKAALKRRGTPKKKITIKAKPKPAIEEEEEDGC